jgi:hypothetical protein
VVFPVDVPPPTSTLRRSRRRAATQSRKNGDRRLANGESGRRDDRRQQAFETLASFGQFGGNAWTARVDLSPDVMRDKANVSFAVCRRVNMASVFLR